LNRFVPEIYHMLPEAEWRGARLFPDYAASSLASEGFIHCTCGERNLLEVAERFYRTEPGDWVVLVLDPRRITSEVRWEPQPDGLAYPHIYGRLSLAAVIAVCRFPRDSTGAFLRFRETPFE
jgi:uncharacterized protein (DUF952 family)